MGIFDQARNLLKNLQGQATNVVSNVVKPIQNDIYSWGLQHPQQTSQILQAPRQIQNTFNNVGSTIGQQKLPIPFVPQAIQPKINQISPQSAVGSLFNGQTQQFFPRLQNTINQIPKMYGNIDINKMQQIRNTPTLNPQQKLTALTQASKFGPQQVGNLLMAGVGAPEGTFTKEQLQMYKSGFTKDVRDLVGKFTTLVQQGKGRNELGQLGDYVHGLGETVFGKDAANLTSKQLANAFDALGQAASKSSIKPTLSIGLGTKNVEHTPVANAGLYDTVKQLKSYGAEVNGDKVVLYHGNNRPIDVNNLPYGTFLSASEKGTDLTGNAAANAYGKVYKVEVPIKDVRVNSTGEFQFIGNDKNLAKAGNKYSSDVYKQYNDYFGSNMTPKEIDAQSDVADIVKGATSRVAQQPIADTRVSSVPQIPQPLQSSGQIAQESQVGLIQPQSINPSSPNIIAQDTRKILTGIPTKERGFVTTVKQSANTPQAVKDLISGSYVSKSGNQLRADAKLLIKQDPAMAEKLAINPTSDVHIQLGNELLNHYYSIGDTQKALSLADSMANSGTELGRAVQAFANYDKTTPEGALRYAQSAVNKYNQLNPTSKLSIKSDQVKSLFDRASKIQAMPIGRERNIAANDLMNEVNNLIPSSIADKAVTVWKAGLLTSLRTHERNIIGNTIHGVAEIAKDIPASLADRAMALRTGQRSATFTTRGLISGTKQGLQSTKDIITKGYDPTQAISKYDVRHITWGNNPLEQGLKKYTDAVFRTLGGADKPFWNASFARSLYDQAGAIAKNTGQSVEALVKSPTPEMLGNATKDANVATFHDTTKLSEAARAIQGLKIGGIPVGQIVAPFTGVPSSIAGQIVAYSPIGLIRGALNAGKVIAKDIPALQRQAAQEIGRGVIGTGLAGIGAYLMSQGLMTGQPKDPQEAAQWQLEGKQANSVLINGKWRSIGSIGPENLIVLAGAKIQQQLKGGDLTTAGANIGKDFMGQTFLQGVGGPMNAITDPNRYGPSYVGNQAASIIPNILKDIAKATDPYARENNNIKDYFTNNLPVLRNQGIVKRDSLGRPIPQEPTGVGAFIDLFNSKTQIHTPVIDELSRLNNVGNNATPSKMGKSQTINGVKMNLTPSQLNILEAQTSPQAQLSLNRLINNPAYKRLSDEDKAKAIDNVMSAVRKQVRGRINLNPTITPQQIIDETNALKTPQQRGALIQHYLRTGVLTPAMLEQMRALQQK